jgi:hypothetical protein
MELLHVRNEGLTGAAFSDMGETANQPFQLSFNAALKVEFQGSRVTPDGGLIFVRELIRAYPMEGVQGPKWRSQFKCANCGRSLEGCNLAAEARAGGRVAHDARVSFGTSRGWRKSRGPAEAPRHQNHRARTPSPRRAMP